MSTPISKKSPNWLSKQSEHDPNLNKNYRRSVKYYRKLYQAWPDWCAEHPDFKMIYNQAKRQGDHVDHIVPICSAYVCGLHVPWNLQILSEKENIIKSNKWWPDCPDHLIHDDFFDSYFEPHQMVLI